MKKFYHPQMSWKAEIEVLSPTIENDIWFKIELCIFYSEKNLGYKFKVIPSYNSTEFFAWERADEIMRNLGFVEI